MHRGTVLSHPQRKRVVAGAFAAAVAWAAIAALVCLFVWGRWFATPAAAPIGNLLFPLAGAMLVLGALAAVLLLSLVRCPKCQKRAFVGSNDVEEPFSRRWGLDPWAIGVVDVLRHGHFHCVHCDTTLSVRGDPKHAP